MQCFFLLPDPLTPYVSPFSLMRSQAMKFRWLGIKVCSICGLTNGPQHLKIGSGISRGSWLGRDWIWSVVRNSLVGLWAVVLVYSRRINGYLLCATQIFEKAARGVLSSPLNIGSGPRKFWLFFLLAVKYEALLCFAFCLYGNEDAFIWSKVSTQEPLGQYRKNFSFA